MDKVIKNQFGCRHENGAVEDSLVGIVPKRGKKMKVEPTNCTHLMRPRP